MVAVRLDASPPSAKLDQYLYLALCMIWHARGLLRVRQVKHSSGTFKVTLALYTDVIVMGSVDILRNAVTVTRRKMKQFEWKDVGFALMLHCDGWRIGRSPPAMM